MMLKRQLNRLLLPGIACLALTGCFDDLTDIKAFMQKVELETPRGIEAIPEVKEFAHVKYESTGKRSPFSRPKAEAIQDKLAQMQDCLQPDRKRVKEPLEKYGLSNLKMKGTMGYSSDPWALIEASADKSLHRVSVGNYMGLFHGKIIQVMDDSIKLLELIPDGTGCWQERTTVLGINESEPSDES